MLGSSCATSHAAVGSCHDAVEGRLASVFDRHEGYETTGLRPGLVHSARRDLELARNALTGHAGLSAGAVCTPRERRSSTYEALQERFQMAEQMVIELEEVRGVRFRGVELGRLIWVQTVSGDEVDSKVASTI